MGWLGELFWLHQISGQLAAKICGDAGVEGTDVIIIFLNWENRIGQLKLGGGNSNMFYFHPNPGEDSHFDFHIFQRGWNRQPESDWSFNSN